jgi:alpha-beta hydrolase superfamily lysophospholipase
MGLSDISVTEVIANRSAPRRPMRQRIAAWTNRRWKRWLALGLVAVVLWLVASLAIAYRLTRRARPAFAEAIPPFVHLNHESGRIKTSDGEELGAWYLPGAGTGPSVLLLHGNGGTRRQCLDLASDLVNRGASVLMISFRAHGDSTGESNDFGFSARRDVVAAVEYLERRRPGRAIVIHGTSLGAAAATFASGELGGRVRGYILECPYRDLKSAVRNRTQAYLPPVLELVAYAGLRLVAPLVVPDLERIAPVAAVAGIPKDVPVLILAGGIDLKATPDDARAILNQVQTHGSLSLYANAGHMKLRATEPDRYLSEVAEFIGSVSARSSPGVEKR